MKLPQPFFFEQSKRAVLLLHAFTGSANDHRMLGRALEKAGYTVYAPNLTGHGTADVHDLLSVPAKQWIDDSRESYQFLVDKGYDQIVVMGLSLGGVLSSQLTIEKQPLAGGTFCSPVMEEDINKTNVPNEFMRYARANLRNQGALNDDIDGIMEDLRSQLKITLNDINSLNEDVRNTLDDIKNPFYIAQAGKDELINPKSGELLAAAIHNAPVTLKSFEKSTHVITVGKQHKEFEETVIEFLEDLNWEE